MEVLRGLRIRGYAYNGCQRQSDTDAAKRRSDRRLQVPVFHVRQAQTRAFGLPEALSSTRCLIYAIAPHAAHAPPIFSFISLSNILQGCLEDNLISGC